MSSLGKADGKGRKLTAKPSDQSSDERNQSAEFLKEE
jgi:hypothetical protein